jgi:alkylated DNA repair dioxygenase AlkB
MKNVSDSFPNLLPFDGEVYLLQHFFTPAESDVFLEQLIHQVAWKQEPIKMFGKLIMQPRLTAWYGDLDKTYRYSGITMTPLPWSDTLLTLKNKINAFAGTSFTSALLNYYRDGKDSMGWHRDNEKELGLNPVIASVTFGAARNFQLRHYRDKKNLTNIMLTHGSLLLMRGTTQHYWEHQLPKTSKVIAARINITFRVIL